MSILLCTLGTTPAVILEAIFANGFDNPYKKVFCITSDGNESIIRRVKEPLQAWQTSEISLSIHVVKNFSDLKEQSDHRLFQEELYKFYLESTEGVKTEEVHVCLAGGFKSMTAALQKAAHLFGAGRLFHVFADAIDRSDGSRGARFPETLDEIRQGFDAKRIRIIDMGAEPGRSFIIRNKAEIQRKEDKTEFINELLNQADYATENLDRFETLPFSSLAGMDPARLNNLDTPLRDWLGTGIIEQLPKIDLHCHLGGYATHGHELKKVRDAAKYPDKLHDLIEPDLPDKWPMPDSPIGLNTYRDLGDATGSNLLSDSGCLHKHIQLLYRHLQDQRVVYAEIRCSPNNYTKMGCSAWEILNLIRDSFNDLMEEARVKGEWVTRVNLIIIVTRKKSGDLSAISRHLALAVTAFDPDGQDDKCAVVGVDLAGFEDKDTRPQYFQTDFDLAHRTGLAVTAHAGENDDVESIWQAVFKLNARRLGHALNLNQAKDLLRAVAERSVGIEMCPYANYQIAGFYPMSGKKVYPLADYMEQGVKVTVNTDNIGISKAGLNENIRFL